MTIKLKGENRLTSIYCDGDVTINDAGERDGTLIVINDGTPLQGNFIIEGGTVKAKATMGPAISGELTVNDGAVYLAGGDGAQAVGGEIGGNAALYGWHENYGWISKEYWMGQGLGEFNSSQYITTDVNPDDPYIPDPTTDWNW